MFSKQIKPEVIGQVFLPTRGKLSTAKANELRRG